MDNTQIRIKATKIGTLTVIIDLIGRTEFPIFKAGTIIIVQINNKR